VYDVATNLCPSTDGKNSPKELAQERGYNALGPAGAAKLRPAYGSLGLSMLGKLARRSRRTG